MNLTIHTGTTPCGHPYVAATQADGTPPEPEQLVAALRAAAETVTRCLTAELRAELDAQFGDCDEPARGSVLRLLSPAAWWAAARQIRDGVL